MKNLSILVLLGLLCATVAADDDSAELESAEIIIETIPAEPVVSQYSSLSNIVQQDQRKVQPIEILTPFGYQGIFNQPQQFYSANAIQGLQQYFPALFTTLGQTNGRLQSIRQSQLSQPTIVSQVQPSLNSDGTFLLNRNVVPVSGVSSAAGGQAASQIGVFGVNQLVPASLQFTSGANQNKQEFQSVSGYLPTQQFTFGSSSSFVPEQIVPVQTSFSQLGINSNQPLRSQFSTGQSISAIGQNNVVPSVDSNSLVSPVAQQSSLAIGGQTFRVPATSQPQFQGVLNQQPSATQQLLPTSVSEPLTGVFLSTIRQPVEQASIAAQNSVIGQGTFRARPQVSSQQSSSIAQQTFRQPFVAAQQVSLAQPTVFGQPTFSQSSPIRQQSIVQASVAGPLGTFGQPLVAGQQTFGLSSIAGQQGFGQASTAGQQTFGQIPATGQQATFGLQPTVAQPQIGQSSAIGQQTFGQVPATGQQATFGLQPTVAQPQIGQSSAIGQQTFGQVPATGQQATFGLQPTVVQPQIGQSSAIGQQTFGQVPATGQQTTFGLQPTVAQPQIGQSSATGQQTFNHISATGEQATFGQPSSAGQQDTFGQSSAVGQQAVNDNSFILQQPQVVEQESRFTQQSFEAQPATFSSSAAFSQQSNFQTEGQDSFSPQFNSPSAQLGSANQPSFGALRSDSSFQDQSTFGVNESPDFESSAAFKTDVAKVSQDLGYDVSAGEAKFNSGLDFDENESFDTKVYDHI